MKMSTPQSRRTRHAKLVKLHDYAFSLLGPRVVLLVDGVDERVVFLILFYKLAHPKMKREKERRIINGLTTLNSIH